MFYHIFPDFLMVFKPQNAGKMKSGSLVRSDRHGYLAGTQVRVPRVQVQVSFPIPMAIPIPVPTMVGIHYYFTLELV